MQEVTTEEIRSTTFSMKRKKAPRLDGFLVGFFQSAWPIVGKDLVESIQSFFRTSKLLKEVNATIITLVHKKVNPSLMRDFRPISCCNVLYQCTMKILEIIRTKLPEVRWWKLVCFSKSIPRHAFILWLVIRNRSTTGERLMKWRYKGDLFVDFVEEASKAVSICSLAVGSVDESGGR